MKNLGFIGFDQYCASFDGMIYSIRSGRFLSPVKQRTGYSHVSLSQDGFKKNFSVHRLIAMAWLDNPDDLPQVNHKDGDKSNNAVNNLEWMTAQENSQHAVATGLRRRTRAFDRKISDELVHKICQLLEDSFRNKDIASMLDISSGTVGNIRHGLLYPDISCEYDFTKTLPSRRKLSTVKLTNICQMLSEHKAYAEIRTAVGVSTATISKIKHRKTGVYISKGFSW